MPTGNKRNAPTKTITARVPTEEYWRLKSRLVQRRMTFKRWLGEQIATDESSLDQVRGNEETHGQPRAHQLTLLTVTARISEEDYWTLKRVLIEHRTTLQDWILARMQSTGATEARVAVRESQSRET